TDREVSGSGGRVRRPNGDEIVDREIGFVANRRNDRDLRRSYCARQTFMIECGKVFSAAASTRNNDHVNVTSFIEVTNASTNLERRSLSLNLRRNNQNVC